MSGFSLNDTKIAIDNILTGDATLLALLGDGINGIVDNTEQQGGLAYPYIVYSSSTAKPWDTKTSNGTEATFTLSAFSRSGDKVVVDAIIKRIHTLLHKADLNVSGNNTILCLWDGLAEEFLLQAKYKKVRGIKWETSKQVRIFYYTRGLQGQAL